MLRGGPPKDVPIRRPAPVLGLRTPDVFALAGRTSPYDPPPSGARAGAWVPELRQPPATRSPGAAELIHEVRALTAERLRARSLRERS